MNSRSIGRVSTSIWRAKSSRSRTSRRRLTAGRTVFLPWGNLLAVIGRPLAAFDGFLLQVNNPGAEVFTAVVDFRGGDCRRFMWQERFPPGDSQFFYPLDRLEAATGTAGFKEVAIAVESTASA